MPLQATSGAASYDAFGGGVAVVPNYIEEVFSTYLYTGNGSTQTITNGIDLSTKGGLVWTKSRSVGGSNGLYDTARGIYKYITSNATGSQQDFNPSGLTAFGSTGFSVNDDSFGSYAINGTGITYVSWTFRKQPKFFDVVTYTGNATARTIAHSLGSVPGCIIVKSTTSVSNWYVYHRSLATNQALKLNSTAAIETATTLWNNTAATSTEFSVGTAGDTNGNGQTFVAYLFAHDAGGFGLTGTDNVISCGSFTTDGSGNATVSLGYEPQVLISKRITSTGDWRIIDIMRGWPVDSAHETLYPNTSGAATQNNIQRPLSTGFTHVGGDTSATYIYIAIRRGPMKVPTLGTSVFSPTYTTSSATPLTVTTNFPVDLSLNRATSASPTWVFSRLTGANSNTAASTTSSYLQTSSTAAESTPSVNGDSMQSNTALIDVNWNAGDSTPKIYLNFRRAPGFFDEVCYTGTGAGTLVNHNLAVKPELIIYKSRSAVDDWPVNYTTNSSFYYYLYLNTTVASSPIGVDTDMTSTTITPFRDGSGVTYVAYLFATCAGVSKVGSYTGTATTKQIDCGFTAGARFVLIKRTDSTGDWYVWDSARGIVAGNDPYLLLNSTAAEVTSTDYVDTYSAGFEISSTAPAAINASGGSFIFLAIA